MLRWKSTPLPQPHLALVQRPRVVFFVVVLVASENGGQGRAINSFTPHLVSRLFVDTCDYSTRSYEVSSRPIRSLPRERKRTTGKKAMSPPYRCTIHTFFSSKRTLDHPSQRKGHSNEDHLLSSSAAMPELRHVSTSAPQGYGLLHLKSNIVARIH